MGSAARKSRYKADRHARIIATARQIAEAEGWEAVTIRRLAAKIEYSQPVLYSHFENRDDIVSAVALEGFAELTNDLASASTQADCPQERLVRTGRAYLDFALRCPAIYAAMFTLSTSLRFAVPETRAELRAGFDILVRVVAPSSEDAEFVAETFWASLHGMVELERSGRIRPEHRDERVRLLAEIIGLATG